MLTYRTNVLLSQSEHELLSQLASERSVSFSQLIREAIAKTFVTYRKPNHRVQLLKDMDSLTKNISTKKINYKELVEYGRK